MVSLENVQRYLTLGFVIHPCCHHEHKCASPGKIPYDPYEGKHMLKWQDHRQFSEADWEEWLECEDTNIGFLTGERSGLIGVDVDSNESMKALEATGAFEDRKMTWCYKTGRGVRYLYRVGGPVRSMVITCGEAQFEILGDGRQSVLPPSIHPSGRPYEWARFIPDIPEPLDFGDRLVTGGGSSAIDGEEEDWTKTLDRQIPSGTRNNTMTRVVGHLLSPAPISKEEALFWLKLYNNEYCKPPLPVEELRSIISSISRREGTAATSGKREILRIMTQYGVRREEAEMMWKAMQ